MAGFFALGRARIDTETLVVLVCTSGSAGAHYLPAMIEADYSGVPLLVITSDRPDHLRHTGAAQTIEQRSFYGHHVHYSAHIDVHETNLTDADNAIDELIDTALTKQGPVHLNVGFDEPLHTGYTRSIRLHPTPVSRRHKPPENTVNSIVDALVNARSGALIWGPNACTSSADKEAALRLIAKLNWPAFAHGTSNLRGENGVLPHALDHWLETGMVTHGSFDCIVYVGQAPTSRRVLHFLESATTATVISLTKGRHAVKPWKHGLAFTGQNASMLESIAASITKTASNTLVKYNEVGDRIGAALSGDEALGHWSGGVLSRVVSTLPQHSQIQVGNSLVIRDIDLFCSYNQSQSTFFANRGVNGIDGQIATAAGMASLNGDLCTVCICGDLTALHDSASLQLAKQFGVRVYVVDNGGGAIFDALPFAESSPEFERFFTTPQSASVAAIAQAYGLRVVHSAELEASEMETLYHPIGGEPAMFVITVSAQLDKEKRRRIAGRMRTIKC